MKNEALIELRTFMKRHNLNQKQLADRIFVPQNRISQICSQKRRFTAETDLKLCKVFNLKEMHFINLQTKFENQKAKEKYSNQLDKIICVSSN